MAIELPGEVNPIPILEDLTPREIVAELDKHIVGQNDAKRAVAIALRNRWRRQHLDPVMAEEVLPKNILMIGSTGVGKTEIARRLSKLARAPFLKIEASKFTEVGYVGRDVEAMIRDLTEIAIGIVKEEKREAVQELALRRAEDHLLEILVPTPKPAPGPTAQPSAGAEATQQNLAETREKFRAKLRAGKLDQRTVEIEVDENALSSFEMTTSQGIEQVGLNLQDMLPGVFSKRQSKKMPVAEAMDILRLQEAEGLIDRHQVSREARLRVEQAGIIFLDEIDKVAGRETSHGPEISREGVQRDLLPIVEGTTVGTRYGPVKTDHILFIAAGAFHVSKPSDLIPELQGRFPIPVGLEALTEEDFVRILTEPENALTKQYSALLSTEGVTLDFTTDSIEVLARLAVEVNLRTENIGARRLATLLERLLEEVSFEATEMAGVQLTIDAAYVERSLAETVEDEDLSCYVL